jgi:hypothetical protein
MKVVLFCLALFVTASGYVNEPENSSSVEGSVTLNGLTPLPNVTIGLENSARGTFFKSKSNASGYYLFQQIRPGSYTIWAEASGYGCILIPRIIVQRGERTRQDFRFVRQKAIDNCEPLENAKPK